MSEAEVKSHVVDGERVPVLWNPNARGIKTLIELSKQSFGTFCDDISGMFGVDTECKQVQLAVETVRGLAKRFGSLVSANAIKAEGCLDGNFQVVFDRGGLFTLAGVI
ncbi:MAG: hypothetical protein ACYSTZ_01245, partial [Planctomycetota bacterium]